METKYKVIIGVALAAGLVAIGRYTAPDTIRVETKTVEVEKKVFVDKVIVVKETKLPDGTVTRETTTTDKSKIELDKNSKTTLTETPVSKLHLVAMGGYDGKNVVWGLGVTKPVLGPIVFGVFGLSNMTFGASIGLAL